MLSRRMARFPQFLRSWLRVPSSLGGRTVMGGMWGIGLDLSWSVVQFIWLAFALTRLYVQSDYTPLSDVINRARVLDLQDRSHSTIRVKPSGPGPRITAWIYAFGQALLDARKCGLVLTNVSIEKAALDGDGKLKLDAGKAIMHGADFRPK